MKSYLVFNLNNKHILSANIDYVYEFFIQFNIEEDLKKDILERINKESDFEISVSELEKIKPALEEKIDQLVVDANFNPFKERLRKLYPLQYNIDPFAWKNTTYYLYGKTNPIDSQILRIKSFLVHLEYFINHNQSIKYILKI